nr:retrovirus-related Pol polyprotein from transposon TNT 1-94 [Tanacetum cinerariifolium]
MFDCDEMFSSETDKILPTSPKYDRYHSGDGYHPVPPPYTGTLMPPKPDLVFHDAPNVNETSHTAFNVELSPTNYYCCLSQQCDQTKPAKTVVTKPHLPPRRKINRRSSPKSSTFPPKVTTAKAPMVTAVKGVQGNWDRFASWQQGIRLYCRGKENGVNILKSTDEGPYQMGTVRESLAEDPVTDEAGPSYDSDILSEVQDHDHYQDAVCAHHEEHVMRDSVQLNHVVDSHADYTSDSNMIPYDQYVKDNEVPVVHSNVSSIPNDAFMMIYNDMCEPHSQSVSNPSRNTVVKNSLTAKLATYKEQVELYERRAKFELTKREKKINEQLTLVISDRNFKKETLKKELHSIKLQLASTINHNK